MSLKINTLILKEGNVVEKEHPHMCTIYLAHGEFNVFAGAGSLISPNMVLSLASGVSKFRGDALVKTGEPGEEQR